MGPNICGRSSTRLNGPLDLLRRQRRQNHMRPDLALATESAAVKEGDDVYVFLRDAEDLRGALLNSADVLGGVVKQQAIAVPLRDGGVRLHGIVMMNGGGVDGVDLHVGRRQSGV